MMKKEVLFNQRSSELHWKINRSVEVVEAYQRYAAAMRDSDSTIRRMAETMRGVALLAMWALTQENEQLETT